MLPAEKQPASPPNIPGRMLFVSIAMVVILAAVSWSTSEGLAYGPEDPSEPAGGKQPTPTAFISPRQEQPVLPENPSMADLGHQTWWAVCMACHGDVGQGLTDEWRRTAFGDDMNCWVSKCHARNHPPEGFDLPRIIPPAWGPGSLKRFVTADELQVFLYENMPWWNPGSLSLEESWRLTAFVLQGQGVLPDGELDISQVSTIPVHLPVRDTRDERAWQIVLAGALGLAAAGLIALRSLQTGHSSSAEAGIDPAVEQKS